jgi:hypothetical protein
MITPPLNDFSRTIPMSVADDLDYNGTAVPNIERIIYNSGTKAAKDGTVRPTLATVVFFADGSKVSVVNSEHDGLQLDADGNPTHESKERGLIYAVMKRIFASRYDYSKSPYHPTLVSEGFGRILNNYVDSAFDQKAEAAKKAAAKAEAAAQHAERQAKQAAKSSKHPSLAKVVVDLSSSVKDMKDCIATLKADLEEMTKKV